MAVVGPSVPARRPFFRPQSQVPQLIRNASQEFADKDIFVYSLQGGWPTANSIFRLVASLLTVLATFSFSFIASLSPPTTTRRIFVFALLTIAVLIFLAAILDVISIGNTARECSNQECTSAVPDVVLDSGNKCKCHVNGWFWFTLAADLVVFAAALVCGVLVARPMLAAQVANPS